MESVFNISGCAIENQVKFATCTLLGAALTRWNGQIRTLGPEAYAITWEVLKKKMMDKYYTRLHFKFLRPSVFLAQISTKKEEDKSEGKQRKDVPIVQDFPKVFPEDFPGPPPARPVEFQIDLILGAAPVA
ncbi:hypothetical protein Tco_1128949 [Tanacetum coccineum]